ncbi:MAG: DUF2956 domain-containing protein [Candidatus Thiodiazotropha lotti]|uniref:DUF2956 domain-containing protein n=1 Tax=Candidatus Thiodiazotropha lotti TaxID=2792787 RepID=A0A9E4N1T9_9GAMM|nr:DUF2956 domain-containing protein [Candidatus Thiodiazotropha lotti]MCG7932843.1 DUF2956 domain-containing protein [Candidatus Thiodiazotropha lotti]MCG7939949.1 DUF2956 domain-containing protein [Candidatus Thiodiazotropha lotti]MCG8004885.1 DUF2956 domain-containing protein [Candidatus Thiodiazotropha lotti]MCG8006214.1 DUF2956 domain-containing protein [Candidatus Thiodiazotropha lotti]
MAKSKNNQTPSQETVTEAMQIARATQRPGQTKEQTKLIAMGIQKGIDQYKKQHKAKLREMDKRRKKEQRSKQPDAETTEQANNSDALPQSPNKLPWVLLTLSWLLFASYLVASQLYTA